MESNQRYYARRAAQENYAAERALTAQARAWHLQLAADFTARARAQARSELTGLIEAAEPMVSVN